MSLALREAPRCKELQEMSVLFCNGDGTIRYADIDGLEAGADGAEDGFEGESQVTRDADGYKMMVDPAGSS